MVMYNNIHSSMKHSIVVNILLITLLIPLSSSKASANSKGQWKLLKRNLGISAMHMQLLPNDKIITFDRTDAGPSNISLPLGKCLVYANQTDCTAHSVEFDPSTHEVRALTVTTETWCSSGALSSDGTLIQTGGYGAGDRAVRYFPSTETNDWIEIPEGLLQRRWYATNHILPDGRVIVVGGRGQFNYEFVPKRSTSDDGATYALPFLKETRDPYSENNLYPFVHLSTDGNLFIFANTRAILLDYVKNQVVRVYPELPGGIARNYPSAGSSALLPLMLDGNKPCVEAEVMVCGGADSNSYLKAKNGTFVPASDTCGRLVITDALPKWEVEKMPMGRVMGDMILLPTGDVMIVNGAAKGTAGWGNARDPILTPLLYKPDARTFEVMEGSKIPRLYHSTAHLMTDGRVLVGGSNPNVGYEFEGVMFPTELSLEAFSPPYVSEELGRPDITKVETEMGYGERTKVCFVKGERFGEVGEGNVRVSMVSSSFTTHSFSMNQRLLVLEMTGVREGEKGCGFEVEINTPTDGNLAPAGYYMLFVVHEGVPSRGKWVHIT